MPQAQAVLLPWQESTGGLVKGGGNSPKSPTRASMESYTLEVRSWGLTVGAGRAVAVHCGCAVGMPLGLHAQRQHAPFCAGCKAIVHTRARRR